MGLLFSQRDPLCSFCYTLFEVTFAHWLVTEASIVFAYFSLKQLKSQSLLLILSPLTGVIGKQISKVLPLKLYKSVSISKLQFGPV